MTVDIEDLEPPLRGKLALREVPGVTLVSLGDSGKLRQGGNLLISVYFEG
jgi:hypothetical protein